MENSKELEDKIIEECIKSNLKYSEVMEAIKNVRWSLLVKAETFLKNADFKKVSACENSRYTTLVHEIKDAHIHMQNEVL